MAKHTDSATASTDAQVRSMAQATGTVMTAARQDEFWQHYAAISMPAIERACRSFARSLTDNAMSAEDMQAWVDDRVWKMIRRAAWPVFHDNPSPRQAAERIEEKAKLLARWAYVALSRQTWRRKAREARLINGMSRSERLASVSSAPVDFEKFEQIAEDLERVRTAVSAKVRAQVAASWQDPEDRRRIALALDATGAADDALINKADAGEIKPNTLDQLRCRSRKEIRSILRPGATILMVISAVVGVLAATPRADAGEQTGGRPGRSEMSAAVAPPVTAARGEQTGGRPGK